MVELSRREFLKAGVAGAFGSISFENMALGEESKTPIVVLDAAYGMDYREEGKFSDGEVYFDSSKMLSEATLTYEIAQLVGKNLRDNDVSVYHTRPKLKIPISRSERIDLVKKVGADIYVQLAVGSSYALSSSGLRSFYLGRGSENEILATEISREFGLSNGYSATKAISELKALRDVDVAATQVELGFLHDESDRNALLHEKKKLAGYISDGVLDYLGK